MSKEYIGPGQFDDDMIVIYDIHEEINIKQYRHNRIESMHKSKRKLLLHYMREKSDFLESITGIKLYENFDFTRARKLQYKNVEDIVLQISYNIKFKTPIDGSICPQCVLNMSCSSCSYALKHKDCGEYTPNSTYRKIISRIHVPCDTNQKILNAIGLDTLKLYFKWNK